MLFLIMLFVLPVLGVMWAVLRARRSRRAVPVGALFLLGLLLVAFQILPLSIVVSIGLWRLIVWGAGRKSHLAASRLRNETPEARPRGLVDSVEDE